MGVNKMNAGFTFLSEAKLLKMTLLARLLRSELHVGEYSFVFYVTSEGTNHKTQESQPLQTGLLSRGLPFSFFFFLNNATCHHFPPPH